MWSGADSRGLLLFNCSARPLFPGGMGGDARMAGVREILRREVTLAVVLSAAAGYIDAVGYLYLGGRFVSFMSGNTTELAASAAHGDWSVVRLVAALLGCFFAGTVLGALLVRVGDGRTTVLTASTVLVALTAILADVTASTMPVTLLLPLSMGVINATFLTAGEASIGLTYMTGALVKAGQRLVDAFFGGPRTVWIRHLALWSALLVGGVFGAWIWFQTGLAGALWLIVGVLTLVTVAVVITRLRTGRFAAPPERREIVVLGPDATGQPPH